MRALFKERKIKKNDEQVITGKSEKFSIYQCHMQDGTHSLSGWS